MSLFAILSSSVNEVWARKHSSSLETRLNYSPSDAFETLPLPQAAATLAHVGEQYNALRELVGSKTKLGLTRLYNRFHNPEEGDTCLDELRQGHQRMDRAVADAYGWQDLDLGHGFHAVPYLPENDRVRFTISNSARDEVLFRLTELNRQRYQAEQASASPTRPQTTKSREKAVPTAQESLALVDSAEPNPKALKAKSADWVKKSRIRRTSR
jgi:hypothetical protein